MACRRRSSFREAGATALTNGDPIPLRLISMGATRTPRDQLEGSVQKTLGDFQLNERQVMIDALPEEVFELAKKLPVASAEAIRLHDGAVEDRSGRFSTIPKTRFIDYVVPGVIGLILQLITVTLMACTIARERESGTLYQLMVTSLRRREIVIGKILPYLAISIVLILVIILLTGWHFQREVSPSRRARADLLFVSALLAWAGLAHLRLLAHADAGHSIFRLLSLPVFVLSGAFAPLEQLPKAIRYVCGIISAHPFLPRLPAGESLSRRFFLSRGRSRCALFRCSSSLS